MLRTQVGGGRGGDWGKGTWEGPSGMGEKKPAGGMAAEAPGGLAGAQVCIGSPGTI